MMRFRHGALFSGMGGFNLAADWMDWENVFDVENNPFCQKVLSKNFPNSDKYEDIKDFTGEKYAGTIDIISGGFPCQPFSVAGQQKGSEDERHLWKEMLRVICTIRPSYVLAENVGGLLTIEDGMVFGQVLTDLETSGYEVQTFIIPACAVQAPHRRDRVWIVAYSHRNRQTTSEYRRKYILDQEYDFSASQQEREKLEHGTFGNDGFDPNFSSKRLDRDYNSQERKQELTRHPRHNKSITDNAADNQSNGNPPWRPEQPFKCFEKQWYEVASKVCRMDDGVSRRVDGHSGRRRKSYRNERIKACGNAIVPQVAYQIFQAIQTVHDNYENSTNSNNVSQTANRKAKTGGDLRRNQNDSGRIGSLFD